MPALAVALALLPLPALAHEVLHHHPHGKEGVWFGLALIAIAAAVGFVWLRGRR
ncbi:MAG: hypothetical protein ACO3FX_12750 [Gemmobacter sp.]